LGRTLSRVRSIARPGIDEIVVVDEGSTDRSAGVAARYADRLLRLDRPRTIAYARNKACFAASGEIIVSMDADVIVPQDTIEELEKAFSDELLVACAADCQVWREVERTSDRIWHTFMNLRMRLSTAIGFPETKGEFQAFKRAAFLKIGGYREDLESNEDIEIMHRISRFGKVVFLPKHFYVEESPARYRRFGYARSYLYWTANWLRFLIGLSLPPYRRISH